MVMTLTNNKSNIRDSSSFSCSNESAAAGAVVQVKAAGRGSEMLWGRRRCLGARSRLLEWTWRGIAREG